MFNWLDVESLRAQNHVKLLPELYNLIDVPQPAQWHPEGDAFVHTLMVLEQAQERQPDNLILQLAALCHDLGKAKCQKTWPSHHGHADKGMDLARAMLTRLDVRSDIIEQVVFLTKYHMHMHLVGKMKPSSYIKMWYDADNFVSNDIKFKLFIKLGALGECDHFGRGGVDLNEDYTSGFKMVDAMRAIRFTPDKAQNLMNNKKLCFRIKQLTS